MGRGIQPRIKLYDYEDTLGSNPECRLGCLLLLVSIIVATNTYEQRHGITSTDLLLISIFRCFLFRYPESPDRGGIVILFIKQNINVVELQQYLR